jgi:hypothetical protein
MATTTLKTQQEDASKWDALSLEGSHHKEHLTNKMERLERTSAPQYLKDDT